MQKQRVHYPFVNLERALARAKEIYDADPSGRPMPLSAAFGVWSYSLKSSGGNQTISALKAYGLLVDSGTNEERKVGLSDSALKYFKDEREEPRARLLQEFAVSPKLFKELWDGSGWGANPPSDAIARSHLKVDMGISEQAAKSILSIYKDNITFANFTGGENISFGSEELGSNLNGELRFGEGDLVNWESRGQLQWNEPMKITQVDRHNDGKLFYRVEGLDNAAGQVGWIPVDEAVSDHPRQPIIDVSFPAPPSDRSRDGEDNPGSKSQEGYRTAVFPVDDGDVSLLFPENISADGLEELGQYLQIFLNKEKKKQSG